MNSSLVARHNRLNSVATSAQSSKPPEVEVIQSPEQLMKMLGKSNEKFSFNGKEYRVDFGNVDFKAMSVISQSDSFGTDNTPIVTTDRQREEAPQDAKPENPPEELMEGHADGPVIDLSRLPS